MGESNPSAQKMGLAVFVKTPGYTPAKTRLGKTIGQENAEQFYLLALDCVRENLNRLMRPDLGIQAYWSVVEGPDQCENYWTDFPVLHQRDGGLGDKLWGIDEQLHKRHQISLFMGSDSPQIPSELMAKFINRCEQLDRDNGEKSWCLIAPTFDGGFWLMGKNKALPRSLWNSVEYSVETTTSEFIARLSASDFLVEEFLVIMLFGLIDSIKFLTN